MPQLLSLKVKVLTVTSRGYAVARLRGYAVTPLRDLFAISVPAEVAVRACALVLPPSPSPAPALTRALPFPTVTGCVRHVCVTLCDTYVT